jgi:hypothetical protein
MNGRTHRALLIGNGKFPNDQQNLLSLGDTPANDLELLRTALTDPQIGLFDPQPDVTLEYSPEDIKTSAEPAPNLDVSVTEEYSSDDE